MHRRSTGPEFDIRSLVTKRLLRGKADIFVTYETIEGKAASPVDAAMFTEYYRQIEKAASPLGLETRSGEVVAAVLRMPDVVKAPCRTTARPRGREAALMEAATEAVTRLDDFRRHEGRDIDSRHNETCRPYRKLSVEAASYDAERVEAVRKRIKDNIEAGGITVDPNRFEQELIFYIEKLDITEEKVRLKNTSTISAEPSPRMRPGTQDRLHLSGDGPRDKHYRLQGQPRRDATHSGGDERRTREDQRAIAQYTLRQSPHQEKPTDTVGYGLFIILMTIPHRKTATSVDKTL